MLFIVLCVVLGLGGIVSCVFGVCCDKVGLHIDFTSNSVVQC